MLTGAVGALAGSVLWLVVSVAAGGSVSQNRRAMRFAMELSAIIAVSALLRVPFIKLKTVDLVRAMTQRPSDCRSAYSI